MAFFKYQAHIDCDCYAPEHIIRIAVDGEVGEPPSLYIDIQARSWMPIYKRLWAALRYVFGRELSWDGTSISDKHEVEKIRMALEVYDELMADYERTRK